jgi:PAS domain S-box-containing protein
LRIAGGAALVVLVAVAAVSLKLAQDWQDLIGSGHQTAETLALVIEEQTSRIVQTIDSNLTSFIAIIDLIPSSPDKKETVEHKMRDALTKLPYVRGFLVVGPDGYPVYGTDPEPRGINLAHRDYFVAAREGTGAEPFIGRPLISRGYNFWFVSVARRMNTPDGEFAGVVVAAIEPSYFERFYRSLNAGVDGAVTLLTRDGYLVARHPHIEGAIGRSFAAMPLFGKLKDADRGSFAIRSATDGVERIIGYRAIEGTPFVAVAGIAKTPLLSSLHEQIKINAMALFAFVALIIVLTLALIRGEGRLRRSREHLSRAQRVAAIGSWEYDFRADALTWSDEVYRIFGVTPETFTPIQGAVEDLVIEQDRSLVREAFAAARAGRRIMPQEYRVRHPDGEIRTVYRETEVILDDAGRPLGMIGVARDVTELRDAERRRDELQRQLQHSQKLEALGTLAGGIAHDINNLLVPIVALSKRLQKDAREGTTEYRKLELIHQAGERARELVSRILTFSRKSEPDRRKIDLSEFTRNVLELLRSSLPATITLQERLEPVPFVLGDEGQLHQVLINLVTNAAQAIGTGIGRISVEVGPARGDDAGSETVMLAVSDDGCGMDAATASRIFEPFFTTKQVGEGTGLGLSVVHGIVVEHGGRISVDSRPGQGTRFEIRLPVWTSPPVEDHRPAD